ncbi:uncharacterized protein N7469_004826 [Penicillium citrinum]|uniref:AMP-activated protein kinase glycogen-binding domain-containing protein n=1 Tax=Penicillium citrinum TaxID=5077 RepID=A0A9W9TRK2_PENCI|nr:uncharacterized protein N7469_004826 [Penicillium citrinum]KAJ5235658.1 hypothetical protein N7469_004826 [Penicillium citrinum]
MGSFNFQWPYDANEVFVTGTFDDWGKTVKLNRVGDTFEKEVSLPAGEKIQYKFVVDGNWTTDKRVREENDGHDNINNVLLPEEIKETAALTQPTTNATMSGVTPDSTTAALTAGVPKEEPNGNLPGTFPDTPGQESEQTLSVNPIPASGGYGNPIKLNPGEKVPDSSAIHGNTVDSTVRLDKESYEKGDSVPLGSAGTQNDTAGSSAFNVPPVSKNTIPESSLPIGGPAQRAASTEQEFYEAGGPAQQAAMADPGYTIQSAAPTSTTAALAAEVPLEKSKQTNGSEPVKEVPEIVKDSIAESHQNPEAAANKEAVEEKKDVESELHTKVPVEESAGAPAPTATAATTATAPVSPPVVDSADVSPTSTPPPGLAPSAPAPTSAPNTEEQTAPVVTTGVETTPTDKETTAKPAEPAKQGSNNDAAKSSTEGSSKDEKKKKRLSGFFTKLKEKLK